MWILSIILIALGGYISIGQWIFAIHAFFHPEQKHGSWIPLVGGLMLCAGLATFPGSETVRRLWWIAFFLDWGSVPGFAYTLAWMLKQRLR